MIYLFHTFDSFCFVLAVIAVHWAAPARARNLVLLAASYVCYAAWDWRFLGLLAGSTAVDYLCGLAIGRSRGRERKAYLLASVAANLLVLAFFKYFRFFAPSLAALLPSVGLELDLPARVILPLGLSYHTFQKISYTVDVYRGRIRPTARLSDFALFVAYFPQLMAGPIEKARDLIPRLQAPRRFGGVDARRGAYLFTYGLFKKLVLADALAPLVDGVFSAPDPAGARVLLGLYAFAIQIYADFSGYTDMARGISEFLGVRLSSNFFLPFFAKGYVDFYRRWHITLSAWIAEYVYAPLSFALPARRPLRWIADTKLRLYAGALCALFATRMVFALWHGASANFIVLGLFLFAAQALTLLGRELMKKASPEGGEPGRAGSALRMLLTAHVFCAAMLLFRSETLAQAGALARRLGGLEISGLFDPAFWPLYAAAAFLLAYETWQYRRDDEFVLPKRGFYPQLAFYAVLFLMYVHMGGAPDRDYIYFRF